MDKADRKTQVGKEVKNLRRLAAILVLAVIFLGGIAGGYFYFSGALSKQKKTGQEIANAITAFEDYFSLRIYYPAEDHLQFEEKRILRRNMPMAIAEATVEAYLKGPAGGAYSVVPKNTRLLGIYKGTDRILYIDLSDEFRRNFQGDVMSEFLLLKGLYESLISNVEDIQDVKVLIEGREIETLGGHFYLLYPLKDMVAFEESG
ncbi:MAG: GerMN domain-containing protein [Nitrospirota bacterium]